MPRERGGLFRTPYTHLDALAAAQAWCFLTCFAQSDDRCRAPSVLIRFRQLTQLTTNARDSAATLLPATLLAESFYEQGRLEEADNLLRFRMPAIRSSGALECATRAYVLLARISIHKGCRDFATALSRDARALGERRSWPRLVAISWAECAQMLLDDGDIAAAEDCVREIVALLKCSVAMPAPVRGRASRC